MNTHKNPGLSPERSQLFLLRLWIEELGRGKMDWRGKIQHVNSGEVRYFHDWPTLEVFIEDLLHRSGTEEIHTPGTSSPEG
jgi:hypothetical protein